jgi:aryl-alcohol dehydrogenase-like predicted oxidoreductase
MECRYLGKTGLKVPEIVLGTQTFGWGADLKTAHDLADRYTARGGFFFDTANIYNDGMSEEMLGSWLKNKGSRHRYIVASKVFFPTGEGPNDTGLSRSHLFHSIDGSLRRLRTDYVDLYQVHCYDSSTQLEETLEALSDLVRAGKVRYLGASNFAASHLQKSIMLGRMERWSTFCCLQAEYSLLVRSTEWELLPLCIDEGVGFLAWSPLAGGWLTGKYRRGAPPPPDSRVGRKDRWDDQPEQRESELTWRVAEALEKVGRARGKTSAQVAICWLLGRKGVTAPIIGARTPAQLEENLGGCGWKLSKEEAALLDDASAIPLPYPYRFIQKYTRRRDGR